MVTQCSLSSLFRHAPLLFVPLITACRFLYPQVCIASETKLLTDYCPKDSIFPMQRPSKERGGSVPPASSLQQAHSRGALFIRAGQRTAPGMFTGGGGNPLPTAFKSFRQDEDGTVMTACEMEANTVSLHPRLSIAAETIIKAASAW